jgi:hypothetical protein
MHNEQSMEDRLWDYIDGVSSPDERSAIEVLLAANRDWQLKYRELLDTHQLLDTSDLEAPSLRFTRNVMEAIANFHVAPATRNYINKNVIRGIAAFFLTLIFGFLTYMLVQFKWTTPADSGSAIQMPDIHTNLGPELNKFGNSFMAFNATYVTVFMLISVIMGFVLLDFYLQRRRQRSI